MSTIRMATVDDMDALIKVRFDYFETENREVSPEQRSEIEVSLRAYIRGHLGTDFFAAFVEEDGQIASVALLSIIEKPANLYYPTGRTGTILNVLTYPQYRRRGLAARAMRALIEIAEQQNLSFLELLSTEAGKPLYETLGFEKEDVPYTRMRLYLQASGRANQRPS